MIELVRGLAGSRGGITLRAYVILAREIGGKNGMGGASVKVRSLTVLMVRFRVDVH